MRSKGKPEVVYAVANSKPEINALQDDSRNGHRGANAYYGTNVTHVFGSIWCTWVFGLASIVIVVPWYIVVPLVVDTDTLASKYAFEPMADSAFSWWSISVIVVAPMLIAPQIVGTCGDPGRTSRWLLFLTCVFYGLMLLIGNYFAVSSEASRLASEDQFAAQFNTYYCESRVVRACLEGRDAELVVLLRRQVVTSTSNATSDSSQNMDVWRGCRQAVLSAMETSYVNGNSSKIEKTLSTYTKFSFLDDCTKTPDVDAWCGNFAAEGSPPTAAQNHTEPAPFALNRPMFLSYTQEWKRRMLYSNIFLGASAICAGIATFSLKVRELTETKPGP